MIFISFLNPYTSSSQCLIITLAVSLTVTKIWPVFCWKTHILPTPSLFNSSKFENVSLACYDCWNFACLGLCHMANYSCRKFSPTT